MSLSIVLSLLFVSVCIFVLFLFKTLQRRDVSAGRPHSVVLHLSRGGETVAEIAAGPV